MELKSDILEIIAQSAISNATENHATATNIKNDTLQLGRTDEILSSAIASGIWTENNAKDFTASLRSLSGEAIAEAHRRLSIAINNGDIEIAADIILY